MPPRSSQFKPTRAIQSVASHPDGGTADGQNSAVRMISQSSSENITQCSAEGAGSDPATIPELGFRSKHKFLGRPRSRLPRFGSTPIGFNQSGWELLQSAVAPLKFEMLS